MDDIITLILIILLVIIGIYVWNKYWTNAADTENVDDKLNEIKQSIQYKPKEKSMENFSNSSESEESFQKPKVKFDLPNKPQNYKKSSIFYNSNDHSDNLDTRGGNNIPDYYVYFRRTEEPNYAKLNKAAEKSIQVVDAERGNWEKNYGLPMTTHDQKKAFFEKLKHKNEKYTKGIDEFHNYLTDESTIIRPTAIDPFRHPELFKNKPIKDIYDQMTENVKAVPKKVIGMEDGETIYADDPRPTNFDTYAPAEISNDF